MEHEHIQQAIYYIYIYTYIYVCVFSNCFGEFVDIIYGEPLTAAEP